MPAPVSSRAGLEALSAKNLRADLRSRSVRGGVLTLVSQAGLFALQSISTVVLARLLTPADFGMVAMVTAITGLGQSFADLGLSEATIQREEISHNQISALFWINAAIGLALTLVTIALAPLLAWLYREPRLRDIALLMSLTFLICSLTVQHDALLKRHMRFISLAIRDLTSYTLAVALAIAMVFRGGGYWALVVLPLTVNLIKLALSWAMVRWVPGVPRRDGSIRSMIGFGANVASCYFMITVNRGSDNVLIGWHGGAGPLGLYSRAYNLLMLPVRQICAPAGSVAIPAFSRLQADPERFARYYLRTSGLIMWIGAPLFGFLFVAAQPVIVVVLGSKWQEAAPVFQLLAISALGQLLFESTVWLFISRGQSDRLLRLLLIVSPIIIASFAIGLPFGIHGVALSGSLVLIALCPFILKFAFRGTELTLRRLGQAIVYPLSVSVAGVLLAESALRLIGPNGAAAQLSMAGLGFAAAFFLAAFIPRVREEVMSFTRIVTESLPRR